MTSTLPTILTLLALFCATQGQLFIDPYQVSTNQRQYKGLSAPGYPPPGIIYDESAPNPRHLTHGAVVRNAAAEAELPQELINPFYKNPQIAAGLAKESWFTNMEFPVINRIADRIPREEIAKIVNRIEHKA